jgi:hypothetical protein
MGLRRRWRFVEKSIIMNYAQSGQWRDANSL